MEEIQIPAKKIPVRGKFDVIVGGSGSAGVCAALAAARQGARTAIVEWLPNVGGIAATGLPILGNTFWQKGKLLSRGIPLEILMDLKTEDAYEGNPATQSYFCHDVDKYRLLVVRKLEEAGVEILTFTSITGVARDANRISHILVQQKEGPGAYAAKVFIDCTGDADIAAYAGESFLPNEIDGSTQPPSLLFFIGGIDETRTTAWQDVQQRWDELRESEQWINPRGGPALSPPFGFPGKTGVLGYNVTRSLGVDATRTEELVRMEHEQRRQADEFFYRFLKPHVAGYENAYFSHAAILSGIRESRRVRGDYVMTREPIDKSTEFPDAVAWGSYPIDRHSGKKGTTLLEGGSAEADQSYYSIPFRVMVPARTENLLMAGRCVSADELAFSAIRVMGITMQMGQAVGIGAAIAARDALPVKDIPVEEVRDVLRKVDAFVERSE
jgi:hypothetical protein